MSNQDRICVGAIIGAFGIKGELRVKSFCADPAAIADYGPLSTEDGTQQFELKFIGPIKGGFAVRIEGIRYRDQAEDLKGISLFAPRDVLPSLPDDEFYHSDLIGLSVLDTGGVSLGHVLAVHDHGAGDFLEIQAKGQKNPVLIPFTKVAVPTVDLAAGKVIVDMPNEVSAQEPQATSYVDLD
ncbi:ribosome maturation factor RimM [Amylibacter marinus]|uniref:Ribosome maturation factor RimM n=1 Tax=Amylibacter marinus TaxID=1475483 RepID=A0ABQ5VXR7_9RHOB|nr:ribosome maturation factor RimM [Amylibacter marinus]GLQ35878.1 ribosome maturation factor RimM [Amylibacter marinus]